ncbi:hypothetical protein V5P93_004934 [Actinokineospora auranticolor]|uniref:hypothetical protein n=1 Tax=Actinokineospora auranticolor TaxID=155976 RepID=UPI0011B084C4|nr:hypothetical protein [Actinokineospora auranticolor]
MSEADSRPRAPRWGVLLSAAACGLGGLLVVVGMFLPWLRSGTVLRDSFQVAGVINTLGFLEGDVLHLLLYAWFGVIPVLTLGVVAYAFGFRRTAATFTGVLAIVTGTVSGSATVESGGVDSSLGIAATGPTTTLIGSALAVLGAVGIVVSGRSSAGRIAGGEQ